MTPAKRLLDLLVILLLAPILLPVGAVTALVLLIREGRPILYISERMAAPDRPFGLIKFRTMRPAPDSGGVTGGDKAARQSRLHRFLRRARVDEIPQIWNVMRGDISLVGPRPPLRIYVEAYPDLYARVLRSRPGVTGLATLRFADREAAILATCRTAEETDAAYRRRCIPRKAHLDLIYQRRRTLCFDLLLIAETALRPFGWRRGGQRGNSHRTNAHKKGRPA